MNKISKLLAISAFSLMILALPSVASAQWYPRQQGPYYGNQGRDLRRGQQALELGGEAAHGDGGV